MRKWLVRLVIMGALLCGVFWLLSTPDIPRSTLEAKYATPPSQFIMLPDGARAHVRDQGPRNASTLVLLHGSGSSLFTWAPWVERLDTTFRVVTMDLPGHGLTGAVPNGDYSQCGMERFVMEVVDQLKIDRFTIAGNSMGGGIAARIAEDYPNRITHLILVDAAGLPVVNGRSPFRILDFLAHVPGMTPIMLHVTPRAVIAYVRRDASVHRAIDDKTIDTYWDFARMAGTREATLARFRAPWDWYVRDHIGRIIAPTLVLSGAEDHFIPVGTAHAFARAIAGSQLIIYPETGHVPQEDIPDQSAADVRTFLMSH